VRLLLDTNAFLWWVGDDARLGPIARTLIADPDNEVFVSAATAWEISIKHSKGKLPFVDTAAIVDANDFEPLAIAIDHGITAGELPPHHRDPFDRVLIAQAQRDALVIVTEDAAFARYDVETVRAGS
jgi:PIN domain nuclease of toxin-antitoxin system